MITNPAGNQLTKKLNIEKIIDELELISDDGNSFLNKETGQLFHIELKELEYVEKENDVKELLTKWQRSRMQIAKKILEDDDFIKLPVKEEINEHQMMLDFCWGKNKENAIDDINKQLRLHNSNMTILTEVILKHNLGNEWYQYKREAFKRIAIKWCENNQVEFEKK